MKKLTLLVLLFVFTATAFAQLEMGIKITPAIAGNRIVAPADLDFEKEGSNLRFGFGIIGDYYFSENAAFSTGLSFTGKGGSISYRNGTSSIIADFSFQYLEIPITVKLFTNEVAPDIKVYFQTGLSLNPLVGAKVNDEKLDQNDKKYTKRFRLIDSDVILGSGLEWQLGESTKVFGGLSYHRGLIDINYENDVTDKAELRNNILSLDLGVKF